MTAVDPLLTSCPRDNCEEAGHPCIEWEVVEVGADGRPTASRARVVEPHPERVEKAERLAREIDAGSERRAEDAAKRSSVSAVRELLATLDADTVASIFDAIRHAPRGIAAIGRVLSKGGATLGVVGSAPDRDVHDHLAAARRHARRVWEGGIESRDDGDRGTGELHLTCEASRLVLAIDGVVR